MVGRRPVKHDRRTGLLYLLVLIGCAGSLFGIGTFRHAFASSPHGTVVRAPLGHVPPAARYAVVIVLDGTRPDDFQLAPMPNLHALMRRGTTYTGAFVGQVLANTPPSHATIGTGTFPKHNGVEGFLWEDPISHTVFNPSDTGAVLNGDMERAIAQSHTPTLAGQIKARYPGARVASVSAHKCYAADAMGTAASDYILCALIYHNRWVAQAVGDHRPPPGAVNNPAFDVPIPPRTSGFGAAVQQWKVGAENAWTMRYALWAIGHVHYPRVLMINFSESDVLGHFTTDPRVIRTLMSEFDHLLGQMVAAYRAAGLLKRTDFVITADHGMSPISHVLPYSTLSDALANAGATPVYIEHDTAAAIGILQDGRARAVAQNIARLGGAAVDATYIKVHRPSGWWYQPVTRRPVVTPALGHAYLTLADTAASAAGPDVLAFFAPHTSTRQTVAYGYTWQAGHLGPQWDDQHIPLILAGPGVRGGVRSPYPARLVDIAPTVERLLNARTGAVDGVELANALWRPDQGAAAAQARRGAVLTPVVAALRLRSGQ